MLYIATKNMPKRHQTGARPNTKPECNHHWNPPERDDNSKLELVPTQNPNAITTGIHRNRMTTPNTEFKQLKCQNRYETVDLRD